MTTLRPLCFSGFHGYTPFELDSNHLADWSDSRKRLAILHSTLAASSLFYNMASSGREDILSCMKLGIEGYIVKPFSLREIGAKILGYYGKKEPERAGKADTLCREILKQSQIRRLLDQDMSKTKEEAEGLDDGADTKPVEAAGKKKRARRRRKNGRIDSMKVNLTKIPDFHMIGSAVLGNDLYLLHRDSDFERTTSVCPVRIYAKGI